MSQYFFNKFFKAKEYTLLCISLLTILFHGTMSELEFNSMPVMSAALLSAPKGGYDLFLNLWRYTLKVDGKGASVPSIRINLEPKTLFVPDEGAMAHLVPQDGSHPLYMTGEKFTNLRKEFLLDHLVLDSISTPNMKNIPKRGMFSTALTLSGKELLIFRTPNGDITVEGIPVKKSVTLEDGAKIFLLPKPLFNLANKVKIVFDEIHNIDVNGPLGPPLDLYYPEKDSEARAPAPPPSFAQPPAPPIGDFENFPPNRDIFPPAPPIRELDTDVISPPAPPFNRNIHRPAPPIGKSAADIISPPAPPVDRDARLPVPHVPELVRAEPPAPPRVIFPQPPPKSGKSPIPPSPRRVMPELPPPMASDQPIFSRPKPIAELYTPILPAQVEIGDNHVLAPPVPRLDEVHPPAPPILVSEPFQGINFGKSPVTRDSENEASKNDLRS